MKRIRGVKCTQWISLCFSTWKIDILTNSNPVFVLSQPFLSGIMTRFWWKFPPSSCWLGFAWFYLLNVAIFCISVVGGSVGVEKNGDSYDSTSPNRAPGRWDGLASANGIDGVPVSGCHSRGVPYISGFAQIPWEDTPDFSKFPTNKQKNMFRNCWWKVLWVSSRGYVGEILD